MIRPEENIANCGLENWISHKLVEYMYQDRARNARLYLRLEIN